MNTEITQGKKEQHSQRRNCVSHTSHSVSQEYQRRTCSCHQSPSPYNNPANMNLYILMIYLIFSLYNRVPASHHRSVPYCQSQQGPANMHLYILMIHLILFFVQQCPSVPSSICPLLPIPTRPS